MPSNSTYFSDIDESSNDSTSSRKSTREPPKRFVIYFHEDWSTSVGEDVKQFFKFPIEKNKDYTIVFNKETKPIRVVKVGGTKEEIYEARDRFEKLYFDFEYSLEKSVQECENDFIPPIPKRKRVSLRPPLETITNITTNATSARTKKVVSKEAYSPSVGLNNLYGKESLTNSTAQRPHSAVSSAIRAAYGIAEEEDITLLPMHGKPLNPAPIVPDDIRSDTDGELTELQSIIPGPSSDTGATRSISKQTARLRQSPAPNSTPLLTTVDTIESGDEELNFSFSQKYDSATTNDEKISMLNSELKALKGDDDIADHRDNEMIVLHPGYDLQISRKDKFDALRDCKNKPRNLQMELLKKVYSKAYITSHSGKGQRAQSGGNPAADRDVLNAIHYFVARTFRTYRNIPMIHKTFNKLASQIKRNDKYHTGEWKYPKKKKGKKGKTGAANNTGTASQSNTASDTATGNAADPGPSASVDPLPSTEADPGPSTPGANISGRPGPSTSGRPVPSNPGKPGSNISGRAGPSTSGRPVPSNPGKPGSNISGRAEPSTSGRPGPSNPGKPGSNISGRAGPSTSGRPGPSNPGKPGANILGRPGPST